MNGHPKFAPRVEPRRKPDGNYGPGTALRVTATELSAAGYAAIDGHPGHLIELRRRLQRFEDTR